MIQFLGNPGTRIGQKYLSFAYCGAVFCILPGNDSVDLSQLNYAYCGGMIATYAKGP